MKLIQTLKNIWKIEELRKRITITFLFVLVYRFGCHVVLPGLDPDAAYRYVQLWCILPGVCFCLGYYALHHRVNCDSIAWHGIAKFPKDAA